MRTDRRTFLKDIAGTAGLVFVGCGGAAVAQQSGRPAHAPVLIRGRRIRTVDVHAHCAVPAANALLRRQAPAPTGDQASLLTFDAEPLARRLAAMDAQGVDVAILSINPNWYDAERDLAAKVIAVQNEAMAAFCGSHADRFAAFASVALQFPDLAAQQLDDAMKKMGFRGAAIGGSVAGAELADAKFDPFWAKAEALGAVIFIHPQAGGLTALGSRLRGNGMLGNVIGNPLETTIALSHLIFEGTLDRFPGLKICAAHGGGYLPSYMMRSDRGCETFPTQCTAGVPKRKPTEYVKQLYYDSLVFTPEALRHLAAEVGADHILMGTDYPYPWVDAPVDHVLGTPGLSDADREAILGGTARALLRLT
jgi:predicted TIM-barrel fold metal-dependent hydrolase